MAVLSFDTKEEIPEDLRENATLKDGKFTVSVSPTAKVDEFREQNLALSRDRDALTNVLGRLKTEVGFDSESMDDFVNSFKGMTETAKLVENGKLIKDTSLEEALTKRTDEMKKAHQTELEARDTRAKNLEAEIGQLKSKVDRSIIDREVMSAISNERSGIRPDATRAVLQEAYEFYTVENDKLVPKDSDGNIVYGSDGATPMGVMEFFKTKLNERAPYVFKESEGGGAGGGANNPNGMTPAQLASLTPQQKMDMARQQG